MSNYANDNVLKPPPPLPEYLDKTMTPSDLIKVLSHLRFDRRGACKIGIDREVRDYLLRAIKAR